MTDTYTLTPVEDEKPSFNLTPVEDESVPQSFLHRVASGLYRAATAGAQETGNLLGQGAQTIEKGIGELGGEADMSVGVMRHGQPVGIRTRPGVGDIMEGISGLVSGATGIGAAGGALEEATGVPKEYTEFALNTLVPLVHQAGGEILDFYRERNGVQQVIGKLPQDTDFATGAKALDSAPAEQNLRDLWQERGIHPAEAVHDAQSDAFLKGELTTKPPIPLDRSGIVTPRGTPVVEGTPRTEVAKTGEPHIDAVLDHPVLRQVINNPIIDDTHEIPNSWGGSVPLDDPVTFRDKDFPKSLTVDGVTFDTAEPAVIHENVEEFVIDKLMAAGMPRDAALRAAYWGWGNPAEHAWYSAHGMDPEHVEAALKPYLDAIASRKADAKNIPPNLFRDTYPDGNPLKDVAGEIDKPTAAEVKQAKAIMASQPSSQGVGGASVGAAKTPQQVLQNLPSLAQQPPRPAGSLVAKGRAAADESFGLAKNIQFLLDPMSTGSSRAKVIAKDAENAVNRIRWERAQIDNELMISPELKASRARTGETIWEQHERMWNAADEESVMQQEAKLGGPAPSPNMGLGTLEPEERAIVDMLHQRAQAAWLHAVDADMVESEGLPAYTPRMVLNVANLGGTAGPQALNELGRNVFTRTAQMLHREYLTAEETEEAAQQLVARRMNERGASQAEIMEAVEKVKIARTIRALPLATGRLEEAVIWKDMINKIEAIGKATGATLVHNAPGSGRFTIAGNPAFTKWGVIPELNPVTGKWGIRIDDTGRPLMQPKPIYMDDEFKGPMKSILDESASNNRLVQTAQSLTGAVLSLKGKAMTAILNSPLIHNQVVWGKVVEAAGLKEGFLKLGVGLYTRGNRIVNNWQQTGRASELIERGLNPIGKRGDFQDISGMMEEPDMAPGRSWTAKLARIVPDLFDPAKSGQTVGGPGDKVAAAIDKAGDFMHNTLLWDRVRDVQFGLADHLSDQLVAGGADRLTADRYATHFANIVVGSIPKSAMSAGARTTANLLLFSRSFTLGNLSTFKQAMVGLPSPIRAQIERDLGLAGKTQPEIEATMSSTQWKARRKAMSTIAISVGLSYAVTAAVQHAFNGMFRNASVNDEMQGYARRYHDAMKAVSEDPTELRNLLARLSPQFENEPGKQDRAYIGRAADGTGVYARMPVGKYGEEMSGYMTQPLTMLRRKLSPLAGGIMDVLDNDQFGGEFDAKKVIYNSHPKTLADDFWAAVNIGTFLAEKHLPESQLQGLHDLVMNQGDQKVNAARAFLPAFGFTASEGYPGGPAKGEVRAVASEADMKFNMAWPGIKKQIAGGDVDGGRQMLLQLGKSPLEIRGLIKAAQNPSAPYRGRTLQNFYRNATPEQKQRFENYR